MKPEEVTRPILFQITYFWDRLMGSGMMTGHWIESPERIDELGSLLEEVHKKNFFDGHRVGSRWTMHSKFVPSVDYHGNFYVDVNVNMDRDDRNYGEAQRTADVFTQTTRNFLDYCDRGDFDPVQVDDMYVALNQLLQQGYESIRNGERKVGGSKYNEAIQYFADMIGISPDELRRTDRLNIPAFLHDNHILEAIVGIELSKSRSKKALEEMEKKYDFFRNPYSSEELDVRSQFSGVVDGKLHPYDGESGLVLFLGTLPKAKKHIVTARTLHDLRRQNDSVTNAYVENVHFDGQ